VLRDGGKYIAVVWDELDRNPASRIANDAVAALYPDDPPSFLARTPFGYANPEWIERDLRAAGFERIGIDTVALKSQAVSARDAAMGVVAGCPLRNEIEERNPEGMQQAVDAVADALQQIERNGILESCLSAHVVTATK
jgi:hypothetical protein